MKTNILKIHTNIQAYIIFYFYNIFQKIKTAIEKDEQIFLRQHGFDAKKYTKMAEEDIEEKLRRAHMQR